MLPQSIIGNLLDWNSFFPFCILQWINLDPRIINLPSIDCLKRAILKFTRLSPVSNFRFNKHHGIILFTYTNAIETMKHYLLQFSTYSNNRFILFDDLLNLNVIIIFPFNPTAVCRILLYGNPVLDNDINREIINAVVNLIESISRFVLVFVCFTFFVTRRVFFNFDTVLLGISPLVPCGITVFSFFYGTFFLQGELRAKLQLWLKMTFNISEYNGISKKY